MLAYTLLDIGFTILHTGLIAFNLLGWVWRRTRFANLVTLMLTGASWSLLGLFYGMGYCPLTDWHWQVKIKLGHEDLPNSYVKWLFDATFRADISPALADGMALGGLLIALTASVGLNWRDWRKGKRPKTEPEAQYPHPQN